MRDLGENLWKGFKRERGEFFRSERFFDGVSSAFESGKKLGKFGAKISDSKDPWYQGRSEIRRVPDVGDAKRRWDCVLRCRLSLSRPGTYLRVRSFALEHTLF